LRDSLAPPDLNGACSVTLVARLVLWRGHLDSTVPANARGYIRRLEPVAVEPAVGTPLDPEDLDVAAGAPGVVGADHVLVVDFDVAVDDDAVVSGRHFVWGYF